MKILYIWDADYPWDIRVEKICKSLARYGNEVHIVARNLKKSSVYELLEGLHIHRMKPLDSELLNYALSFPAFFSPYWKNLINKTIEEHNIDIIIVRDLPMAAAGVWAGQKYKIPVIFDMAEDYCAMLREIWKHKKFKGFNLIVRNPYLAKMLEKYVINKFDHIIVVVEEAKNLIVRNGIGEECVTVVGNTPELETISSECPASDKHIELIKSKYAMIYTGGITRDRGITVVLDSIPEIKEKIHDFLFVIVGKGDYSSEILDIIERKKLHQWVLLTGWIDHKYLYDYIKECKLGIIPHYVTDHIITTIPNKIFDYMACGIPVIASDAPPLRRIILEEKCGRVFTSGDSKELSDIIISIYMSKEDYGSNGKQAINNKYNWLEEEKKLISVIKSIYNRIEN